MSGTKKRGKTAGVQIAHLNMINTNAAEPVLHARGAQAFNAVRRTARGRFTSPIHSSNKVHLGMTQVSLPKFC